MKKMSRQQQLRFTIIGGIAIVVLLILATVVGSGRAKKKGAGASDKYQVMTVKKADPLAFKGIVQPQVTENFFFDPTLGKISQFSVTDGQVVKAGDVIAVYQSSEAQDQATQQTQSLNKANAEVSNASSNFQAAQQRQQELTNRLNQAKSALASVSGEDVVQKQELQAKVDAAQQALDTQTDVVMQAKQAVTVAQIELSSANAGVDAAQKKVTATVSAPFDGTVYLNEKGKNEASVPFATVVSPETQVKATVSEYDYRKLKKDQAVKVRVLSERRKEINGVITKISELPDTPLAAEGSASASASTNGMNVSNYTFTVSPAERLHYGYNVQVSLEQGKLILPLKAVLKTGSETVVFVYRSGKVYKQKVTVKEVDGSYWVESGVKEKDRLISNPDKTLTDGQKVAVSK